MIIIRSSSSSSSSSSSTAGSRSAVAAGGGGGAAKQAQRKAPWVRAAPSSEGVAQHAAAVRDPSRPRRRGLIILVCRVAGNTTLATAASAARLLVQAVVERRVLARHAVVAEVHAAAAASLAAGGRPGARCSSLGSGRSGARRDEAARVRPHGAPRGTVVDEPRHGPNKRAERCRLHHHAPRPRHSRGRAIQPAAFATAASPPTTCYTATVVVAVAAATAAADWRDGEVLGDPADAEGDDGDAAAHGLNVHHAEGLLEDVRVY